MPKGNETIHQREITEREIKNDNTSKTRKAHTSTHSFEPIYQREIKDASG